MQPPYPQMPGNSTLHPADKWEGRLFSFFPRPLAADGRGAFSPFPPGYYPQMPGNSTFHPADKWEGRHAFRPDRWGSLYECQRVQCLVLPLSDLLREEIADAERVALLKARGDLVGISPRPSA